MSDSQRSAAGQRGNDLKRASDPKRAGAPRVNEAKPIETEDAPAPPPKRRRRLVLWLGLGSVPLLLAGSGYLAAAHFGLWPQSHPAQPQPSTKAAFVDLPEMALTLPNGGQPRQMRIKLSLEVAAGGPDTPPTDLLTPKVYDALLTYFRTLRDGEFQGTIALDRMRGDLYRRLTLVLGPGVLRDVLITGLVVA